MKSKGLGCLTINGIAAFLITVALLSAVFFTTGPEMFSPGALLAKTGQALGGIISHTQTGENCAACHPAPWDKTSMAQRCLACHQDVSAQLQQPQSLHTVLKVNRTAPVCRPCHTEHKGPNASITNIVDFPHDSLGFSLAAHPTLSSGQPFTCQDCHSQGLTVFDQSVCTTCHQTINAAFMQKHNAAYGSICLDCHDGKESYGKAFNHNKVSFVLTGKHTTLDCGACHTGARSIADLKATKSTCYDCHQKDDIHQGDLGQECAACHTSSDWKQATFDHSKSTFPLTGAHTSVACAKCHANNLFKGTPSNCYACHQKDDHHNGAFGQDCANCHTTTAWLPATFDHTKTAFPLTGAHTSLACTQCHADNLFKGTPTNCYACHQKDDHHNGAFGQDCSACHTTTAWLPASFDHSKSAFPLTGAHTNLACTQCHLNNVFKGTPTTCNACHADPAYHLGLFGLNCVSCHTPAAWLPAAFNQAHTFPLAHGGAGGNCQTCHPNSLAAYTCYSCHANIKNDSRHAGFANLDNCITCHANGRGGD